MAEAVTNVLTLEAEWETLDRGSPEDRACFSALGIRWGATWLTEADDAFVHRVRDKVHLSAYRLAEWFAWNWWRLRWEPRRTGDDWALAHRLPTIGGGYVWPNIVVFSDGERVALLAKPTRRCPQEPLRYLADVDAFMPASVFEGAVDPFVEQVLGHLRAEGVAPGNLDRLWADVLAERADAQTASLRRFEALLGFEPDQAPASVLDALLSDAASLGEPSMHEVAADHAKGCPIPTASSLQDFAKANGFAASPSSAVRLNSDLPPTGAVAAWLRGAKAAQALRTQETLGLEPLGNATLSQLAGVSTAALTSPPPNAVALSFAVDGTDSSSRVVLRSKWEAGRRFDLARILGDRLTAPEGRLYPATGALTYRQKLQRAFAAELLCPFEALDGFLGSDVSEDAQRGAAEHFQVSELMVSTILANHGRVDRPDIEKDVEVMLAV